MSRWWGNSEGLRIELRPFEIVLTQRPGFSRTRKATSECIAVTGGGDDSQNEPWRACLNATIAALHSKPRAGVQVDVVLSSHFVRYALVPWSENIVRDSERLAFARLILRNVYGANADAWEVCLDEQPAGQSSFACAVDRALLAGLSAAVSAAGARLGEVTPVLADCINRHRRLLKDRQFCLAHAEPGRVTLAFRSHLGWQSVRGRRFDGSLTDTLPSVLKQEATAGSAQVGGVLYLCAPQLTTVAAPAIPGWRIVMLADVEGTQSLPPARELASQQI
ncbi:MAG: hypothetical protein ABI612_22460 [Betaproteobacteria bacterium]